VRIRERRLPVVAQLSAGEMLSSEEVPMTVGQRWPDGQRDDSGLVAALQRNRTVRAGLAQVLVGSAALLLGLVLPKVHRGPQISTGAAQPFLFAVAGGLITFIALVFSLLFLMIQYATTTFSPRLTIFRDDRRVWRAFAVFIGAFVYSATAGLQIGSDQRTTAVVPALAMVLVLVSLGLARNLQLRALRLLQMNTTLEELRSRGAHILMRLYTEPAGAGQRQVPLPSVSQTVCWKDAGALLLQVDLAGLRTAAADVGAVICLHVGVGEEIGRGGVVVTVHGATRPIADRTLLQHLQAGPDRRFGQDPLLAFRLLSDIAIRALSPAINDPASAVSAIAAIDDLVRIIVDRELDIGRVEDSTGVLRVVLKMPSWDDFLVAGVDDLAYYAASSPMATARLAGMLDELVAAAPPQRRAAVEQRRQRLAERRLSQTAIDAIAATETTRHTSAVGSPVEMPIPSSE
jgi:uncharacterized membrane protein